MTNDQTKLLAFVGGAILVVGILIGAGWLHLGPSAPSTTSESSGSSHPILLPSRDAERLVAQWNTAEGRHDIATLESMYAPHVLFYHRAATPNECADLLRVFYATHPTFVQQIDNLRVFPIDGGALVCATFDKTYPTKNGIATVRAYLVFDSNLRIEEESDNRTDEVLDPNGSTHRCTSF